MSLRRLLSKRLFIFHRALERSRISLARFPLAVDHISSVITLAVICMRPRRSLGAVGTLLCRCFDRMIHTRHRTGGASRLEERVTSLPMIPRIGSASGTGMLSCFHLKPDGAGTTFAVVTCRAWLPYLSDERMYSVLYIGVGSCSLSLGGMFRARSFSGVSVCGWCSAVKDLCCATVFVLAFLDSGVWLLYCPFYMLAGHNLLVFCFMVAYHVCSGQVLSVALFARLGYTSLFARNAPSGNELQFPSAGKDGGRHPGWTLGWQTAAPLCCRWRVHT